MRVRLGLLFDLRVLLRFGDQLLDFLTALVADLLVEIRTVTLLHDLAAAFAVIELCLNPAHVARTLQSEEVPRRDEVRS